MGDSTPDPAAPLVEAVGLRRSFGHRVALAGVDVSLRGGECLALFGPNGAGKTTLLRVLAGLLTPTAGMARVAGTALPGGPAVRALTGLISHQTMLYPALTALENVEFAARLFGVDRARDAARAALDRLGVGDRADAPVRALSRGLAQRVAIARAVVHGPRVLLADEPFTGLDAAGATALTRTLEGLVRQGAALVVVTHNIGEGLALATHAAVMQGGRFTRMEAAAGLEPVTYAERYRELVGAA